MNVLFMGTPDFAVISLKKIISSEHRVAAVVTVPDKPQGRGQRLQYSAVKKEANLHDIPVLQPADLKDEAFIAEIESCKADIFVVVAFKILPPEVFNIPEHGTLNLHASLLPKFRGAAPINWAIMNGETETGVTTIRIDNKVDTGDILLQSKTVIEPDMTAGQLHDRLAVLGSELLVNTLNQIQEGTIIPQRQDDRLKSKAPKINREIMKIDFKASAKDVHNKIRGLSPYPGAFCFHRGKTVKLLKSVLNDQTMKKAEPGAVVDKSRAGVSLQCGEGVIDVLNLQPEGKKNMPAGDFINGTHLELGEIFS